MVFKQVSLSRRVAFSFAIAAASIATTSVLGTSQVGAKPLPVVQVQTCSGLSITGKTGQLPTDPAWDQVEVNGQIVQQTNTLRKNVKSQGITAVAFSPNGQVLASGSQYISDRTNDPRRKNPVFINVGGDKDSTGGVEIWSNLSAQSWNGNILYDSDREVNFVAFSPNGRFLAAGGNDKGFVGLWDQSQWSGKGAKKPLSQSNSQFTVKSIAFSPDGKLLASGGLGGPKGQPIQRWEIGGGTMRSPASPMQAVKANPDPGILEKQEVFSVTFSPDSKFIVGGGQSSLSKREGKVVKVLSTDSFVHVWESASGKYVCTMGNPTPYIVTSTAFSPDGSVLAAATSEGSIQLWSVATGQLINTINQRQGRVNAIAFSPSGELLLVGSKDRSVKLWQVKTGQLLKTFQKNSDEVMSVAFRPDGQAFATGSKDNTIQIYAFPGK